MELKQAIESVCLSVRLFPLYLLTRLIFNLIFVCLWVISSPGIESQGHGSKVKGQCRAPTGVVTQ